MTGIVPCYPRQRRRIAEAISPLALLIGGAGLILSASPTWADSGEVVEIKQLQSQIQQLQSQLNFLAARQAQSEVKTADLSKTTATIKSTSTGKPGAFILPGGVNVTLGGFVAAESVYRTRNETASIGSSFNGGIPYPNSPNYHEGEFRGTGQQSRISLLAQAAPDPDDLLSAYFETDFLGAAPTANSNESNSYNLRVRQVFASWDNSTYGFHLLGGQAWSLLTQDKKGITPRSEDVPLTIDAQYVPGFTWTRNYQLRAVEQFSPAFWAGVSLESPQAQNSAGGISSGTTLTSGPLTGGQVIYSNTGTGQLNTTTTYATDIAPDIIAKLAFEPGWGHYEVYGVGRFFRDRLVNVPGLKGGGKDNVTIGGGVGAAMILPIIPDKLEVHASMLAGYGIGRYGSAQLPDVTFTPSGSIALIPEYQALLGIIGHPVPTLDVYSYIGTEQAQRTSFNIGKTGYGYGAPQYVNSGCYGPELTALGCSANTSGVAQATLGFWYKFYKGSFGTMQVGLQDSYTKRYIFSGVGGGPQTDENIFMSSFRYYPFS